MRLDRGRTLEILLITGCKDPAVRVVRIGNVCGGTMRSCSLEREGRSVVNLCIALPGWAPQQNRPGERKQAPCRLQARAHSVRRRRGCRNHRLLGLEEIKVREVFASQGSGDPPWQRRVRACGFVACARPRLLCGGKDSGTKKEGQVPPFGVDSAAWTNAHCLRAFWSVRVGGSGIKNTITNCRE